MQTMKFKFKRIFIIPASWYHSARLVLVPFITSQLFVDEMVKPLAPKPQMPTRRAKITELSAQYGPYDQAAEKYYTALKISEEALLTAWHKEVSYTSNCDIRYNGDGHYTITVDTTIGGPMRFIAPFKQQWPVADSKLIN